MVTLDKIIGQTKALQTIDKIIIQEKRGQALMLTGPPGIGKYALANYAAARFLCTENYSACGKCFSCRSLINGNHPDFLLVFPFPNLASESKKNPLFHFSDPMTSDARFSDSTVEEYGRFLTEKAEDPYRIISYKKKGNIPVSVVKDMIRATSKRPMLGGRRAIVVCDIDQMAYGAADLFLKTVEEPPDDSLIILTSSHPHALLPTLLSRTIRIALTPINDDLVRKYLESRGLDGELEFFIRYGAGSPGLAYKAYEDDSIVRRDEIWQMISGYLGGANLPRIIENLRFKYQWANFDDVRQDFAIMEKILRDLYIVKMGLDNRLINIDIKAKLNECARAAPLPEVLRQWFKILAKASRVHRINNVAADIAFVGAFIEFDRARAQG